MSTAPQVNPGDLITADYMNELAALINDLETRVGKLESGGGGTPGGPPVLTSLTPPGSVQVDQVLELSGLNFGPFGQTTVAIGEATVTTLLSASTATALFVSVPPLASLPRNVPVTVTTPQGTSNSLQLNVVPKPVVNSGRVFVDDDNSTPQTPQPGTPAQYQFQIRSATTLPDTYQFKAAIGTVNGSLSQQQWQSALSLNTTQQLISPGTPFLLVVTVNVPLAAQVGDSANLTVTATSTDGLFSAPSNPVSLTVGQPGPVSDPRIQLSLVDPQPDADPNGQVNPVKLVVDPNTQQQVITVPAGTGGFVAVNVVFADMTTPPPLNYQFTASLEGAPTTWHAGTARPATLPRPVPGGSTVVNYAVTNMAASGDAQPHDAFMDAKAAEGAGPAYQSFARFLIRNAG